MELLSFIFKEDVDAVGLSKYKDDKDDISGTPYISYTPYLSSLFTNR